MYLRLCCVILMRMKRKGIVMKKTRLLALLLALLMLTTGAFAENAEDPVVIKAGDTVKTLSEVQAYFDDLYTQYNEYYAGYGLTLSQEEIGYILEETMYVMTMYAVLDNKVAEMGLGEITEEQKAELRESAKSEFEEGVKGYAEYYGISNEEAMEEFIAYGVTEDAVYEDMLTNLPYERLMEAALADIVVSDEDVLAQYNQGVETDKATYAEDVGSYEIAINYYGTEVKYTPAGYRMVKHILLDIPAEVAAKLADLEKQISDANSALSLLNEELYALENVAEAAPADATAAPDASAEPAEAPRAAEEIEKDIADAKAKVEDLNAQYEAARAEIVPALKATTDEIYAKLEAGESFDALVEAYGQDPGMVGNTEGYMVHAQSIIWDTIFRDTAVALAKVGDTSEPVLTDFGVHIIHYAADVPEGAPEMTEETREALRAELLTAAQDTAFAEKMDAWMAEMAVETYPELVVVPTVE